jgi:hypothetical protein
MTALRLTAAARAARRALPLGAALAAVLASPAALARVRVAVTELTVEGSTSPALTLQLQDGFVLGLARAGLQVVDPVDSAKGLEAKPELAHCDSSACLKSIGQLLDVRYIVRVKVDVAGNSYKAVGRVFSTEGATPAALPIANNSKSCDVCTVAEARDVMLRLADALKVHLEEPAAPPPAPRPPEVPSPPANLTVPVITAMAGAMSMAVGFAVLGSTASCAGTSCPSHGMRNAVGGGFIGAGLVLTFGGGYVAFERGRAPGAPTTMSLALRW